MVLRYAIITLLALTVVASSQEPGRIALLTTPHGEYWRYDSRQIRTKSAEIKVLVVVHGSFGESESAKQIARKFIERWTGFADKYNLILIAPAFDRHRYQSYGGYRGLFGRTIGADQFVNGIVDGLRHEFQTLDRRFYLYGHSAGGQFVIRFSVRHPERILRAVASAPGRFCFPNRSVPWPYGAGPFSRTLRYEDPSQTQRVSLKPDWDSFIEATEIPLTVVVGSKDTEPQPKRPGHIGSNRVELARNWVESMNRLAQSNGRSSNIRLKLQPGIGHSSARLTTACAKALFAER